MLIMIKIEMTGAEFDNFLMILRAKIEYCSRETDCTAKTRSDRDFELILCYTPKAFSCLEEIKFNIKHCLELAPSFPKMYNITMF